MMRPYFSTAPHIKRAASRISAIAGALFDCGSIVDE
jgi:hypothetical protein